MEVTAPIRVFFDMLNVDADCSVLSADPSIIPVGYVATGLTVTAVGGTPVLTRSDLRAELNTLWNAAQGNQQQLITVVYAAKAQTDTESKDDLDFDSDDEESAPSVQRVVDHTINAAVAAGDRRLKNTIERGDSSILAAISRIDPGACLLLLCEGHNPAIYVETAAKQFGSSVMYIDAATRMKSKLRMDEFADVIKKGLENGLWLFIENATKSISLLEKLSEVRQETALHPRSRVLLLCEPHPHFPVALLQGSATLRLKMMGTGLQELAETLGNTQLRINTMQAQQLPGAPTAGKKKRVKIAPEVDIVSIETSHFLEMSTSVAASQRMGKQVGEPIEPGTMRRHAKYKFGPGEKLISLCKAAEDRFAVGTSGGYVVVLDNSGLPLVQYRPHKACIWDVAFASLYDFSTASEDGTSSIFHYDLALQELEAISVASFQSDVFALSYAEPNNPRAAVLSGGLSATICILHSDRKNSSFIAASTTIQAMAQVPATRRVLFGGGNGLFALVDPETSQIVDSTMKHSKKVPAVSCCGTTALSGSFDKTLRVWDVRSGMHCSHNLVMTDVLTAVSIDDNFVAACSGSSLYMWDLRNLHEVLCVKNKAWSGLTRGLEMDASKRLVVTASVDGCARFWNF